MNSEVTETRLVSLRAIDALRAGVPNRDAVRHLGSAQPHIEQRFYDLLESAARPHAAASRAQGILISGPFGSGKSHMLEHLQHLALERNFVCSKVVISKETPLFDLEKVLAAAVQNARMPDRRGSGLNEIHQRLDFRSAAYVEFYQWVTSQDSGLSPNFAATVYLAEHMQGEASGEHIDRILRYWAGGSLGVADLRGWLRELGVAQVFKVEALSRKRLALQRYAFLPRLMTAARYAGWVLLVDEVELLRQYTPRQRVRSYAELARLLGHTDGSRVQGLATVLTIVPGQEYTVAGQGPEHETLERLRASSLSDDQLLASQAERGIRAVQREAEQIDPLDGRTIREVYDRLKGLYDEAYGYVPDDDYRPVDLAARMREHIKRWINTWDLRRADTSYQPEIVSEELAPSTGEDADLETPEEDDAPSA